VAATVPMSFGIDPMFVVLPFGDEFVREDAQFYTDLELAYQEAFDWSVELGGRVVYIYEQYKKDFKIITKVWA
jgi:hypothetical protein